MTKVTPGSDFGHLFEYPRKRASGVRVARVSFSSPLLSGENRKFGPRIRMQLLHDSADVVLDGTLGQK